MARTRQLKPDFYADEDLAVRSPMARLLFAGLWLLADRKGRLEDRPLKIRAALFPYEAPDVDALLSELAAPKEHGAGAFILRYEANGRKYIQVCNFEKHQRCHPKEPDMNLPGPAGNVPGSAAKGSGLAVAVCSESVPSVPSKPSGSSGPSAAANGNGSPRTELASPSTGSNPHREEYVREVWAAWCKKRGGDLPDAGPTEEDLARALYEDGVPLRIALRAIEDCSKPPRGVRTPLQYVEPAFDEAARHWRKSMTA